MEDRCITVTYIHTYRINDSGYTGTHTGHTGYTGHPDPVQVLGGFWGERRGKGDQQLLTRSSGTKREKTGFFLLRAVLVVCLWCVLCCAMLVL